MICTALCSLLFHSVLSLWLQCWWLMGGSKGKLSLNPISVFVGLFLVSGWDNQLLFNTFITTILSKYFLMPIIFWSLISICICSIQKMSKKKVGKKGEWTLPHHILVQGRLILKESFITKSMAKVQVNSVFIKIIFSIHPPIHTCLKKKNTVIYPTQKVLVYARGIWNIFGNRHRRIDAAENFQKPLIHVSYKYVVYF